MVEWFTTSKAYFGPNNAKGLERFLAAFYSNFFDVVLARPNFGNHLSIRVLEVCNFEDFYRLVSSHKIGNREFQGQLGKASCTYFEPI